jgi:hypothetical protein
VSSRTHTLAVCVALASFAALVAHTATAARTTTTVLTAHLSGSYLHTGSKGSGSATVTFKGSKVCWKLTYAGIDSPGDSGIHIAPPPTAGVHKKSVFPFTGATSTAPGCVAANHWGPSSQGWAAKIVADPGRFYVIVATKKDPQGEIGGVLHPSP